jgi:hypothetical protein
MGDIRAAKKVRKKPSRNEIPSAKKPPKKPSSPRLGPPLKQFKPRKWPKELD